MNAITLHAIGLARGGNWRLLDALEVSTRSRREPTFAGMVHATGSVALLGYLDSERTGVIDGTVCCPDCDGDGEVEIVGATGRVKYTDCPWCDGDGKVDAADVDAADREVALAECRRWTTLNGDPVEVDPDTISRSCWMSFEDAARVIAEYTGLVAKLAKVEVVTR